MKRDGAPAGPRAALAKRAAAWALELVAMPSVTGTPEEAAFAARLRDRLAGLEAFTGAPGDVWTVPVEGDPLGRASVAALVRGSGGRTLILTGHYDTVRFDDYGELAPLATSPDRLREALVRRLASNATTAAERLALADLRSGDFLPGRGLLDMKSGLAAGLAVLEAFAAEPARTGNLLFIAVPDEEANSAGARGLAQALPGIATRFGLSLEAAVNLDALVDDGDGATGRSVALGTIGKLLPSALFVGQAVHASNSMNGLNAGVLAAAVASEMEWSVELAERSGEEPAPAPTLLGLKDNRVGYDVTTPDRFWAYWNVMTQRRRPEEVLAIFAKLCRKAVRREVRRLAARAASRGTPVSVPDVPVLTFAALHAEASGRSSSAVEELARLARSAAARGLDLPEQCRILTEHAWTASGRSGPAVIIGFASLPYLPTELSGREGQRLEAASRRAARAAAEESGVSISVSRYFPGISDMSFLGQAVGSVAAVAANTPAWRFGVDWPYENAIGGVPIVNAGPWGRDYHTPFERVHARYAFDVLPDLVMRIVREVLSA